jgi:hypothetical protein
VGVGVGIGPRRGFRALLWELKIKFNSLANPNLIAEVDTAGQGRPGLGARLEYRTARLGPSMNMPTAPSVLGPQALPVACFPARTQA